MVISVAARAAAKIASKKRAIVKAHRIKKTAKPRVKKTVKPRVKKTSLLDESGNQIYTKSGKPKTKKQGKQTTVHLTTVGKSNTSVAAKKAAAIKQIKNMNIDRNQGIIIGIKGTLPRQPDRVPTWGVTTSPTLPNAKAIKIQKAIEYVKKAKVKKGQNIVVKKGPGEWTPITSRSLTFDQWKQAKTKANKMYFFKTIKGLDVETADRFLATGTVVKQGGKPTKLSRKHDAILESRRLFFQSQPKYLFGGKVKPIHGKGAAASAHLRQYQNTRMGYLAGDSYRIPSGIRKERIYSYPGWSRPTKKAPRTVAGMDKYAWGAAGAAGGMGATGYAVGKYDKEIGEHVKGNIKAHVKTGDAAIDVIKERRDQLLRRLGII